MSSTQEILDKFRRKKALEPDDYDQQKQEDEQIDRQNFEEEQKIKRRYALYKGMT